MMINNTFLPVIPNLNDISGLKNRYSFFHTYFQSLYPDMYNEMLKNMGQGEPTPDPAPQPTDPMTMQPQRQERSREEIAAANKIRMQDRLKGKYTIQGQVVGQQLPEFTGDEKGINSVINKFVTGKESTDIFEGLGKLGKVSLVGALNKFNDNAHAKNIQQIINSNGKEGGVGIVFDPATNRYVGLSFSETDLGEKTSALVKSLTGSSTGKRRTFVGNVPDVVVLDGNVYDTTNAQDRFNLMNAMQANNDKYLQTHNTVNADGVPDRVVTQTDVAVPTEDVSAQLQADEDEREKNREAYKQEFKKEQEEQLKDTGGDKYTQVGEFEFNTGGFIGGMNPDQVTDAQTVADDYPIDSDDGDFMINAAAIEKDPQRFNEIISAGLQKAREKGIEVGDISGVGMDESGDVLASKGEFLVKKPLAETIGYDILNQFNDQGKPEVDRRVAASGGFLDGYANGGEVDLPATRPSAGLLNLYEAIKEKFPGGPEPARKTTKEFLNQMSDEEALALTAITEASILGEKGLESVMHVVNNRINSDYQDFKSQFNVKDVLNRQTAGGAFQFTGLEIKGQDGFADLRTHVTELVTNPQAYRNYMKTVDMARDVLAGKRKDFTGGALFYYNPKASTSEDFKNKVADRTYVPIYYMRGKGSQHIYFSPQDIYRPELPVSRPETPAERIQKKSAQPSFLDDKVDLSGQGMFGTYLQNRPSLQY
tara:strand:- start:62 stop:2185 length:2124 start_codon:yes stop_codon:yes gene_type:complete